MKSISLSYDLRGYERTDFVIELAERWGELNVVHSFREGNTRAQSVFFAELSQQTGSNLQLANVLAQIITGSI